MNDFKEFRQPRRLRVRSEWRGLYEFLVKDTEGGDRKWLHNSALNPPGGKKNNNPPQNSGQ